MIYILYGKDQGNDKFIMRNLKILIEEIFECSEMLMAVVVLIYMILWMNRQAKSIRILTSG